MHLDCPNAQNNSSKSKHEGKGLQASRMGNLESGRVHTLRERFYGFGVLQPHEHECQLLGARST